MKRILCALLLCSLLCALMPAAFADGVQQVSLSIPCTVTVDVGEHGKVYANSTTWAGPTVASFQVWPGTRVSFLITPGTGYTVDVLTLSGTDVRGMLRYGVYSTVVDHDETLVVRFVKRTALPSPTPRPVYPYPTFTPQTTVPPWQVTPPYGPKTGDESAGGTWAALLVLAAAALIVLLPKAGKHPPGPKR